VKPEQARELPYPMTVADFPALNATLNALSTAFIAAGWWLIRNERKTPHIACMVSAIITSSAFLTCYLIYHAKVGSIRFTDHSIARPIYYFLLITHVVLAFAVAPLVTASVIPALRARWDKHRRISRWTMPIWLYVSVTGVIVYFMLYRWFPSDEIKTRLTPRMAEAQTARLGEPFVTR
jgi:putative membrane protein